MGAAGHHAVIESKLFSNMKYRTKVRQKAITNITRRGVSRAKEEGGEKSALRRELSYTVPH